MHYSFDPPMQPRAGRNGDPAAAGDGAGVNVARLLAWMMIGQLHGESEHVARLRAVFDRLMPDPWPVRACLALASALAGDAAPAREALAEHQATGSDEDPSRVALALSLKLAGSPDWRDAIGRINATCFDADMRALARLVDDVPLGETAFANA